MEIQLTSREISFLEMSTSRTFVDRAVKCIPKYGIEDTAQFLSVRYGVRLEVAKKALWNAEDTDRELFSLAFRKITCPCEGIF